MKRLACVLAAVSIGVACVPPTEKRNPAGAAGFVTEPSAAARGGALTSSDGWTVVFDKLIVQASVTVEPFDFDPTDSGSADRWFLNGRVAQSFFTRALETGNWAVRAELGQGYFPEPDEDDDHFFEPVMNLGLQDEDVPRFRRPADVSASAVGGRSGPSILVSLHATKGTREARLDATIAEPVPEASLSKEARFELRAVRADTVAAGPLGIAPEKLLYRPDGVFVFDPIANADTDGDGRVTALELSRAPSEPANVPEVEKGDADPPKKSLLTSLADTLSWRVKDLLVRRGPFVQPQPRDSYPGYAPPSHPDQH